MAINKSKQNVFSYRHLVALFLILLSGLFIRGIYHVQHVHEPDYNSPILDPQLNDYWARALVSGDWTVPPHADNPEIRESPYGRPPGYPWLLGGIYAVSGSSYHGPRILQFFMGMLLIPLLYLLGSRLFDVKTGLVTAALMAVYWGNPYFEGELNSPVWECALLVGIFLLFLKHIQSGKKSLLFCTGLLCGISLLFRPNLLMVLFFMALYLLGQGFVDKLPLRRVVLKMIMLLLAVSLPVVPVLIRNWMVSGELVFISYYGGVNAYIGNNPHSDGVSPTIPDLDEMAGMESWNCFNYPELVRGLGERLDQPDLSFADASSWFYKKAMRFLLEHPLKATAMTLKKAWYFWGPHTISDSKVVFFEKRNSRLLRFLPGFTLVAALALTGFLLLLKSRKDLDRRHGLLLVFIVSYFFSILPFFMSERYRFPVMPFLLPLAAVALVQVENALREKNFQGLAAPLLLIAGAVILLGAELYPYTPNEATWYLHRGFAYAGKGQQQEALQEFEKALEVDPAQGEAMLQIGYLHAAMGDRDQALARYLQALEVKPENPYVLNNLGYEYYLRGDYPKACSYFEAAIERRPRYTRPYYNLGNALLKMDQAKEALKTFEHILIVDPEDRLVHLNLGHTFAALDQVDKAREHYERYLQYWPESEEAQEGLRRLSLPESTP